MLINGELDIMSDVSYTEERAEHLLYPSVAMGSEEYYLFTGRDHVVVAVNRGNPNYESCLFRIWRGRQADWPAGSAIS